MKVSYSNGQKISLQKSLLTVMQRHYNKDLMWKIVFLLKIFFLFFLNQGYKNFIGKH